MIIGMDVDDVVADLISEWLNRYRNRTGDPLWPEHIRDWHIAGYAKKMPQDEFFNILHEPDLYGSVRPHGGALNMVNTLKDAGHRIVFITACVGSTSGAKRDWLLHHGFLHTRDKYRNFIAAHDKSLISGVDILIDDRVENVELFPKKALLVRRPHNEDLACFRPRAFLAQIPDLIEFL
jgi:5'(3')-deoxyribonucleotidase